MVMQVKFHKGVISNRGYYLTAYIFMIFSVLSHNLVSNGWNFMQLILSIHDHGVVVVMHLKFCQGILSNRGVIAL